MLARVFVVMACLTLSACVQPAAPVVVDTNVPDSELEPFRQDGVAVVSGQALLRQSGGAVVTCAGTTVKLVPDLPPVRQIVTAARAGNAVEFNTGQNWLETIRETVCDSDGNFRFKDLPPQDWFIFAEVKWNTANGPQGGTLGKPVSTKNGSVTDFIITDADWVTFW